MTSEAIEAICYARFPRFRCCRRSLQPVFYISELARATHARNSSYYTGARKGAMSRQVRAQHLATILKLRCQEETVRRAEFSRTQHPESTVSRRDHAKLILGALGNDADIETAISVDVCISLFCLACGGFTMLMLRGEKRSSYEVRTNGYMIRTPVGRC